MKPETLRYAKTHEWVALETAPDGSQLATVGLSDFAVKALTDLVFVDLPPVGRQVAADEPLGEIESVKAVSDIYSPVDGEVAAANSTLAQDLARMSEDPFGDGWLVKIRVTDPSGMASLMDYAAYQKQCAEEETRD